MTDYYSVLKKAVGGLGPDAGDVRRVIYDKARSALLGQLKAIQPPLTTAEISRQRLDLEEAIRRVEREVAAPPRPRPVPEPVPPPAAPEPTAGPEPAPHVSEEIEAEFEPAPEPADPVAPPPVRMERPAPVITSDPSPEPEVPAPRLPGRPGPRPLQVDPEDAPRRARSASVRREPSFADEASANAAPAIEVHRDDEAEEPRAGVEPVLGGVAPEPLDEESPRARSRRNGRGPREARLPLPPTDGEGVEPVRRSRWPLLIGVLLVCLMLGGIAALAWSQRAMVSDIMGGLLGSSETSDAGGVTEQDGTASGPGKITDRLGDAPAEEAPRSVRTVDPGPAPEGVEGDPLSGVVPPEETPPAPDVAPEAAAPAAEPSPAEAQPPEAAAPDAGDSQVAAAPQPAPPAAPATPDDGLVAQKAILYEQPTDGGSAVTALNANVVWRFLPDSSNGPEIQAEVDVPERGLRATINIRKNTDTALPASHLVEVILDTPGNFPGGGVKAVPAFVMKPTEEARGQPLDGAAAKVADGFFWIAFASDAAPMAQNIALMRDRNWIDIPIIYNNDQRAILTLEKGTPGQRVFERALAAWGE